MTRNGDLQHILLTALQDPSRYGHPVQEIRIVETHISHVLLTGRYAYKIKKPLDLQFLDFSTLERRRHYCEEELRLNRRLAPELYLAVVAIGGSHAAPVLDAPGPAIEYAVKMLQFADDALLDRVLARGALLPAHIEALAEQIASFHATATVAGPESPHGTAERVHQPALENFEQTGERLPDDEASALLAHLHTWSIDEYRQRCGVFAARKALGRIRECHGDMHLGNMVLRDGRITIFDCIEFNESLRWIDVMSEAAFVAMDLDDRGRPDLARRFLNAYLEATADYAGLRVLRYYRVYRAMVRAKVAAIRLAQPDLQAEGQIAERARALRYLHLAERYTRPEPPGIYITCGPSGSGKSVGSLRLLEATDAVRVRSDVMRKALFGLGPQARSGSDVASGLYSAQIGTRTYERLAELSREIVAAGYPALIDAAFLKREQRDLLRRTAAELGVPFRILAFQVPEMILRERVTRREREGRDASEAGIPVLEHQLRTMESLAPDERAETITIDTAQGMDLERVLTELKTR
jgi:uncharacterized protein